MLLFIPSIVVNAVLLTVAIYAMWTRGIDLPRVQAQPRSHRQAPSEPLAA